MKFVVKSDIWHHYKRMHQSIKNDKKITVVTSAANCSSLKAESSFKNFNSCNKQQHNIVRKQIDHHYLKGKSSITIRYYLNTLDPAQKEDQRKRALER